MANGETIIFDGGAELDSPENTGTFASEQSAESHALLGKALRAGKELLRKSVLFMVDGSSAPSRPVVEPPYDDSELDRLVGFTD